MDSLTQIVLGAAVGEVVLGKKVGNKAMLCGAIAGTIPDLDVLLRFTTDAISATEMHRGFSHSLIFSILFAPFLAWIVQKVAPSKGVSFKEWSWLFFWSLVTHPILDAHTTWGTQFFWPFDYRLAFKNIFVADPLYTLPFLICVLVAAFLKRDNKLRSKFNYAGLGISTFYMILTFVFKLIGYNTFEKNLESQGVKYVELDTKPTPLNTLLWNAQVETKNGYLMGYYSILDDNSIVKFSHEYPKNHDLLKPYLNQKVVRQLIHIAAGWYTVSKEENYLIFTDLRFGQFGTDGDHSPFIWKYKLEPQSDGQIRVSRLKEKMNGSVGSALIDLATRVTGG